MTKDRLNTTASDTDYKTPETNRARDNLRRIEEWSQRIKSEQDKLKAEVIKFRFLLMGS